MNTKAMCRVLGGSALCLMGGLVVALGTLPFALGWSGALCAAAIGAALTLLCLLETR